MTSIGLFDYRTTLVYTRNSMPIFLGMLVAVAIGWIFFVGEEGLSPIDVIGDQFVVLITSEESRLAQLESETEQMVRQLIATLQNDGLTVFVGQTLRSPAQEKTAIDAGRSAVKTHSWHESGRAVDLYPINPDTLSPDMNGVRDDLFVQMQQAAVSLGFHQIAYNDSWERVYHTNAQGKKFWDGGHVEWHGEFASATDAWNDYNA